MSFFSYKKMTNPKIPVLMPVYYGEKHLDESANSILDQTFKDLEFIIRHQDTGYLCKTDAQSIADAIKAVLSDVSFQKKMGENARHYVVDNYSLEHAIKMELDVIRKVIAT